MGDMPDGVLIGTIIIAPIVLIIGIPLIILIASMVVLCLSLYVEIPIAIVLYAMEGNWPLCFAAIVFTILTYGCSWFIYQKYVESKQIGIKIND